MKERKLHPEDILMVNRSKKKKKKKKKPKTIILTEIPCQKVPCYMRESSCRWHIVRNAKIF